MKSNHLICIVIALIFTATATGCSVKYTARVPGFQPVYTDQQLGESTYQVKIGEAWPKDWPDLEKFAMYRAAEITESKGRRYFAVLNASSQMSNYYITSPMTSTTSATGSRIGNTTYINANTTTTPSTTTTISGGWYILDFKVLLDSEINSQNRVVDGQQIKRDLQYFINSRR